MSWRAIGKGRVVPTRGFVSPRGIRDSGRSDWGVGRGAGFPTRGPVSCRVSWRLGGPTRGLWHALGRAALTRGSVNGQVIWKHAATRVAKDVAREATGRQDCERNCELSASMAYKG